VSAGPFDQTTTAFHQVEARPTGQLTMPPDNSIVSPTATSFPNLDSACPTADGEFATVRHQPWDFATRRGILQLQLSILGLNVIGCRTVLSGISTCCALPHLTRFDGGAQQRRLG
jgi:hypothetical protein